MKRWLLTASVCCALMCACTIGTPVKDGAIITTNAGKKGSAIKVQFERGVHWLITKKMGPATIRITPQIVVWAEDTLGNYRSTLYVTESFGAQKWKFMHPNPDTCFRPMCMPYWMNKFVSAGNHIPTRNNPLPDAVTAATPTGSFTLSTMIPEGLTTFNLCAEYNRSFDDNETYTAKATQFNGQPSVVFACRVDLKDTARRFD
ncbi:MAG TPA: hypothetical protein VF335_02240, partial [Chitinivibrionales bacterium]